jgi:hypothetical protein
MKITYLAEETVSVWIGNFTTENEFDQSVSQDVATRLNLRTPIESICEVSFNSKCVGLRELLGSFSGYETFIENAVGAGRKLGIEIANAALICYYLKCEDAPDTWGQLRFLGSFGGSDIK